MRIVFSMILIGVDIVILSVGISSAGALGFVKVLRVARILRFVRVLKFSRRMQILIKSVLQVD